MKHSFFNESLQTLSHATAIIGATNDEQQRFVAGLGVSPYDTVVMAADESGGIGDVRVFSTQIMMSPQFGDTRLGIIYHAEKLTPQAQNALLKLLEEPPVSAKIVLFLGSEADVLATVFSRCRMYHGSHATDNAHVGPYLDDPMAQMIDAETLAKDEHVASRVRGWLVSAYESWSQAGRPASEIESVLRFWRCYQGIEAGYNKRLLLEQLVLSSL